MRGWPLVLLLTLLAGLGGCGNSPYPPGAAEANTLYTAFTERSPRHLDPVASYWNQDTPYTHSIYEPLLAYHYLKRPYTLIPRLALAVPEPVLKDAQGRTLPADAPDERVAESVYEIAIRPGVRYQPHPAFARDAQGRWRYHGAHAERLADEPDAPLAFPHLDTRELVAADFVLAFQRHATPRLPAPIYSLLAEHVVGMADYAAQVRAEDQRLRAGLSADAPDLPWLDFRRWPLAGVTAPDAHTLRIRLKGRYPAFRYWLATTFVAPVPWEVEAFHAEPGRARRGLTLDRWPVGTGPYMLAVYEQDRRHVLVRNPHFRHETYPCEGMPGDAERGLLADCGQPLPFIDRVEFRIEREAATLKTKFLQGWLDAPEVERTDRGSDYALDMRDDDATRERLSERGLQLPEADDLVIWYLGFNMLDPIVGQGDTPERQRRNRALRQAVAIALDWGEHARIFPAKGGREAMGPLPAGIAGSRLGTREGVNPVTHRWVDAPAEPGGGHAVRRSLDEARALLREAGYPDGRDAANGQPLVLHLDFYRAMTPELRAEIAWLTGRFAAIGITLDLRATDNNQFQDKVRKGRHQLYFSGWGADYPDAENFLFLLHGPNGKSRSDGENLSNYADADHDALFRRIQLLPDGPTRQALIDQAVAILQRDTPWAWGYVSPGRAAWQPWVRNAGVPVLTKDQLRYLRLDTAQRARLLAQWNAPRWQVPLAVLALSLAGAVLLWRRLLRRRAMASGRDPRRLRP
ncbi:ABC transporter substrate-binding protein [Sphaerotilus mobilis]|uniref:ABC-type transport system substrate-binding protein n=1 Tax=Sphaerotilus mobilis TaxID=47994 RepID=A0A4Q7LPD8_9BURK|nr:ABC transporter substrate-binding protein [Sphaerotilus mobilis]RZS56555.1 ABC-type transport system substrate-binding protein [Sphaerotilus mobilis]